MKKPSEIFAQEAKYGVLIIHKAMIGGQCSFIRWKNGLNTKQIIKDART